MQIINYIKKRLLQGLNVVLRAFARILDIFLINCPIIMKYSQNVSNRVYVMYITQLWLLNLYCSCNAALNYILLIYWGGKGRGKIYKIN